MSLPQDGRVWYCAIGSMMSPNALRLRGVRPARSLWCEIQGHRRVHYAPIGMATLFPEVGALAHAVAHDVSLEELRALEGREPPSKQVSIVLHCGARKAAIGFTSVATCFILAGLELPLSGGERSANTILTQESSGAHGILQQGTFQGLRVVSHGHSQFDSEGVVLASGVPLGVPTAVHSAEPLASQTSARYRDLMLEGARAAGMDEAVVASFAATPATPRPKLEDFERMPPVDQSVSHCRFSLAQLRASDLLVVFRGRVFELEVPYDGPGAHAQLSIVDYAKYYSEQFYDPMYGFPPDSALEPWEGWPFIEDFAKQFFKNTRHVGWYTGPATCIDSKL